jgi:hypothetical protein
MALKCTADVPSEDRKDCSIAPSVANLGRFFLPNFAE